MRLNRARIRAFTSLFLSPQVNLATMGYYLSLDKQSGRFATCAEPPDGRNLWGVIQHPRRFLPWSSLAI